MEWPTGKRLELLRGLQSVEQALTTFFRLLLGLIIVGVFVVVAAVIVCRPWGAGNQGEWFYFSIGVLMVLGWAIGQFIALGRRQRDRWPAVTLSSSISNDGQAWHLQFGENAPGAQANPDNFQIELARNLVLPLGSVPAATLPNEEVLRRVEMELNRGVPIEEACQFVEPAYRHWSALQQKAYRLYVTTVMDQRRGR
jgi:hypothetical protein